MLITLLLIVVLLPSARPREWCPYSGSMTMCCSQGCTLSRYQRRPSRCPSCCSQVCSTSYTRLWCPFVSRL